MLKYVLTFTAGFLFSISSFSQQTVGLFAFDSTAYEGYTLFSPFSGKSTYLLNNCGHEVRKWTSNYTPGAISYLKPNGNLVRAAHVSHPEFNQGGGNGGRIEEFDWDGNLVWYINLSSDSFSQHHDFEILPNGNILVLMWEIVPRDKAIAAGRFLNESQNTIWQETIWELEPIPGSGARVVWKWEVMDHVVQELDETKLNYGQVKDHPELIHLNYPNSLNESDWLHFNSIDYNEDLDQIMLSCRSLSEIYIIDHSTSWQESGSHMGGNQGKGGDLLYRYGNPLAYQRGTAANQVSFEQHDAQWIPKGYPNAGKVIFFNNGGARLFSSVDIFKTPVNQDGSYSISMNKPFGPSGYEWSYTATVKSSFYSNVMAGVDPLPNGHFLICESTKGRIFEINGSKKILWEYINPVTGIGTTRQGKKAIGNFVFRGFKYSVNNQAFKDKELIEGLPLELDPLPIFCDDTTSSNGEDTSNTGGEDTTAYVHSIYLQQGMSVFPNPFKSNVTIVGGVGIQQVNVVNTIGQTVYSGTFDQPLFHIDLSQLEPGFYTIRVSNQDRTNIHLHKLFKNP